MGGCCTASARDTIFRASGNWLNTCICMHMCQLARQMTAVQLQCTACRAEAGRLHTDLAACSPHKDGCQIHVETLLASPYRVRSSKGAPDA